MNLPIQTYELKITPNANTDLSAQANIELKQLLLEWLSAHDIDEYVEGIVEDICVDLEYGESVSDCYDQLGGVVAPVSVFKYGRDFLESCSIKLQRDFGPQLKLELLEHPTETWTEGWKKHFEPILTQRFVVYPPWRRADAEALAEGKFKIEVEPGMAFGTGQHPTTKLCLRALEEYALKKMSGKQNWSAADIGTGTGILGIGAKMLGADTLSCCDIDPDAVRCAKENFVVNHVAADIRQGSADLFLGQTFDVVFANILGPVLRRMLSDLAEIVAKKGVLILSGILREEAGDLEELGLDYNLKKMAVLTEADWACLILERGQI